MNPTPTTLEDKVGQMLMAGFHGYVAPDYFLEWLRDGRLGGVILFARNVKDPAQLAALCQSLHEAAKYPLLIAIDQEGGTVARLRDGFAESPGALALSSITAQAETLTERVTYVLGAEMRAIGINWTYAPVVDVTYNRENTTVGTRSFGRDPQRIAKLAHAAVKGFQSGGVAACAKHFPGLGDTAIDTHLALPRLNTPLEQLKTVDLIPYQAISAEIASIMTTHTIFNALDPDQPATHSPIIVQKLLREMLQFEGVITTDCMEMKAIDDNYPVEESVMLAANAGIDIILFSHTAHKQNAAYEGLLAAAQTGQVSLETIDAATARIAAMKAKFPASKPDISAINSPQHQATMLEAAKVSISLLHQAKNMPYVPQADQKVLLVEFSPIVDSLVQESASTGHLSYFVQQRLPFIQTLILPARASIQDIEAVMQHPAEVLIIASRNAHLLPPQADAVRQLASHAAPQKVLLALRNPYDAELVENMTVLCSAGDSRPSLEALAAILAGDIDPVGAVGDAVWN